MAIRDLNGQVLNWANLVSITVTGKALTATGVDGKTYTLATSAPAKTLSEIYAVLDSGYTAYAVEE